MFDIDSGKLLIVAVLALVVIGPKELPRVLRLVGQSVGKMRRMATEFQGQFMDAMKEADIADIRKELDDLNKSAALDVQFDPARDIQTEFNSVMTPSVAVAADVTTSSPTEGFSLPSVETIPQLEGDLADVTLGATGEGPVDAELGATGGSSTSDLEENAVPAPMNGSTVHLDVTRPKRKIFVKRRTSAFALMQAEAKALQSGEPLVMRRRSVRAKADPTHGTQNS